MGQELQENQKLGNVHLYAMKEGDGKKHAPFLIKKEDAKKWNEEQHAIYHTANSFYGTKRKKESIARVNAWFVEVDGIPKEETIAKLKLGLQPSLVIESKNGYHIYWVCFEKDFNLAIKSWDSIIYNRLIPFYSADPKARDLTRILRHPGFFHWKDVSDPFLVKKVFKSKCAYTVYDMAWFYDDLTEKKVQKAFVRASEKSVPMGGTFWTRANSLDCEYALTILSGHPMVDGESFSFTQNSNGNKNILVDGGSCSCWIDKQKLIGSFDEGGPSVVRWLLWYEKRKAPYDEKSSLRKIADLLKSLFPELEEQPRFL